MIYKTLRALHPVISSRLKANGALDIAKLTLIYGGQK
jgi:hypothetical protein